MKVLILSGRLLYPANTGARIRSARLFERLARIHDVTIACFKTPSDGPEQLDLMRACCSRLETIEWTEHAKFSLGFWVEVALNLFSRFPFAVDKYVSRAMQRRLAELVATGEYRCARMRFRSTDTECACPAVSTEDPVSTQRRVGHSSAALSTDSTSPYESVSVLGVVAAAALRSSRCASFRSLHHGFDRGLPHDGGALRCFEHVGDSHRCRCRVPSTPRA